MDFDHSTLHECDVTKKRFKLYELEPPESEVNCPEVWETSLALDFWTPSKSRRWNVALLPLTRFLSPNAFYRCLRRHVDRHLC